MRFLFVTIKANYLNFCLNHFFFLGIYVLLPAIKVYVAPPTHVQPTWLRSVISIHEHSLQTELQWSTIFAYVFTATLAPDTVNNIFCIKHRIRRFCNGQLFFLMYGGSEKQHELRQWESFNFFQIHTSMHTHFNLELFTKNKLHLFLLKEQKPIVIYRFTLHRFLLFIPCINNHIYTLPHIPCIKIIV